LSVSAAVELPLALRGTRAPARRARVRELLAAAGLGSRASALPSELSGGERQRLALCAALAHRPALLLADEPTGELDAASAETIRMLIVDLARRDGTSVMIASHDAGTAAVADRTVRIRDGRVVEERFGDEHLLVISHGGWVRLPEEMLADAGIGDRARALPGPGGLVVQQAGGRRPSRTQPAPTMGDQPRSGWTPAEVELSAVSRSFRQGRADVTVIDALSYRFAPGQLTAVTGRSGTGKTTLLRMLAGLDAPTTGAVLLDGTPITGADAEALAAIRRRRIGFMAQDSAPVGFLSALENVLLALRIRGWSEEAARSRAFGVLTALGLGARIEQRVHRLSSGESQRVALGRAMACARGLLIVDEPTSRLDEAGAREMALRLAAAASEDGQTVICATHEPEVIRRADHVLSLDVERARHYAPGGSTPLPRA
jgi:ABC-type lipoprotein export system ATPase subunit